MYMCDVSSVFFTFETEKLPQIFLFIYHHFSKLNFSMTVLIICGDVTLFIERLTCLKIIRGISSK